MESLIIRPYQSEDERGWLHCRVLAFLEGAYYDDVLQQKEHYKNTSIELVAELDGSVVGLIDIECESGTNVVCTPVEGSPHLAGMIWHVATHPDHHRNGIARSLLNEAKKIAQNRGLSRLEAWTRDDEFVNAWYRSQGFHQEYQYYHIFPDQREIQDSNILSANNPDAHPVSSYIHYIGDDQKYLAQFKRVHECRRFDLWIGNDPRD